MAKFAPVAPPRILREMKGNGGSYHLVLAHDILRTPEEYRHWRSQLILDPTVILDNSITELGSAVDVSVIEEAAEICEATVIVLPDVYNNMQATIDSCTAAHYNWPHDKLLRSGNRKYMFVPQGNTLEEFTYCAEALKDSFLVGWWGIPRNLTNKLGTREKAAKVCAMLNPTRRIHLLGFSDNIIDDMLCASFPWITGIDSAVPLRAATEGKKMSMVLEMGPRGKWFEQAPFVPLMQDNVDTVGRWVRS